MQSLKPIAQPVLIEHKEMQQARPAVQLVAQSKGHSLALLSATAVRRQDVGHYWAVSLVVPGSQATEMISTDASTMTACVATNPERITKEFTMSKFKYRRSLNAFAPALTLAVLLGSPGTTLAEEGMKKEKVVHINEYTCQRLISVSSDDRAAAIAFLHGYRAGLAGKKSVDTEKLGIVSDRLVVHCLDNPTDTAVVGLDKVSKTIKN
jgi:hypothetical protein